MSFKQDKYATLLDITKQNHGEQSQGFVKISSQRWFNDSNEMCIDMLLLFENNFNNFMKQGIEKFCNIVSYEYGIDPSQLVKIEFGKGNDGKLKIAMFHSGNKKFYTGDLYYTKKDSEVRDFVVGDHQEI